MAGRTKYLLMSDSEQTDDDGLYRVDVFTFPIQDFRQEDIVLEYVLTENDVYRFDQFILSRYGR